MLLMIGAMKESVFYKCRTNLRHKKVYQKAKKRGCDNASSSFCYLSLPYAKGFSVG